MADPGVELLGILAGVQAVIAALLLALLTGHVLWLTARTARWRERRHAADAQVRRVLAGGSNLQAAENAVAALPFTFRAELLTEATRSVRGARHEQIVTLARRVGVSARAEHWCGSRRRIARLRGVRLLASLGAPSETLDALLADAWAPVRAEAARLAGMHADPRQLRHLVQLLTDPSPLVRFAAKDALVRHGAGAAGALADWFDREASDGAALADALDVAVPLAHPAFAAAVDRHRRHVDGRVRARVAALAAALGGQASIGVLEELLDDPDAEARAAAASGLGHLGHWPAAAHLSALLRDPSWAVRLAAGLALCRLDAPGALYLRRGLRDPDAFARDMAQQVLDLPHLRATG